MKFLKMVLFILFCESASQAELQAGRDLSKKYSCHSCHGETGISSNDEWPNLAHQKKNYLVQQLKNFKSGVRANPLMTPMAMMLSDDEIDTLAEYFSKMSPP